MPQEILSKCKYLSQIPSQIGHEIFLSDSDPTELSMKSYCQEACPHDCPETWEFFSEGNWTKDENISVSCKYGNTKLIHITRYSNL